MAVTQTGPTSMSQEHTDSKEGGGVGRNQCTNGREEGEKEVGGDFIPIREEVGEEEEEEEEANSSIAGTRTTVGGACGQEDDPLMTG